MLRAFLLSLVVLVGAAPAAASETIGGFDPVTGLWHLRNPHGVTTTFYFGDPGDVPVTGDWDCDGVDTPGLFRRSDGFAYLRNSNTQGIADLEFFFGDPGDIPVAGDWDGDGCDTLALYRPAQQRFFVTDRLGGGGGGIGSAETTFAMGDPGDRPLAGDFDGDGVDTVALHRPLTGEVFLASHPGSGEAVRSFAYGNRDDVVLAGSWAGDATDGLAAFRPARGRWYLSDRAGPGAADRVVPYGLGHWAPVAGDFRLPETNPGRGVLVVSATGDVDLDGTVIPNLRRYGHDYAWSGLDGLFLEDDVTIVNLECAPSPLGTAVPKSFNFRCDQEGIDRLAPNGIDVANLANNHTQDFGPAALVDGIDRLRAAGVAPVGAGRDLAEATTPAIVVRNGWTVAVVGFNGIADGVSRTASSSRSGVADGNDAASMADTVRAASAQADLVFVSVHWGIEGTFSPDPADRPRASAMARAGATAVFGHHPHRLQALEEVDGAPIFWSLGNFVWPKQTIESATTAVAEVVVQPDGLVHARLIPARIVDSGHPALVGP